MSFWFSLILIQCSGNPCFKGSTRSSQIWCDKVLHRNTCFNICCWPRRSSYLDVKHNVFRLTLTKLRWRKLEKLFGRCCMFCKRNNCMAVLVELKWFPLDFKWAFFFSSPYSLHINFSQKLVFFLLHRKPTHLLALLLLVSTCTICI